MTDEDLTKALYDAFGVFTTKTAVRKYRQRLGITKMGGRSVCQIKTTPEPQELEKPSCI